MTAARAMRRVGNLPTTPAHHPAPGAFGLVPGWAPLDRTPLQPETAR